MSVKKTCILRHVNRKTKTNLQISFDLASKAWQQPVDLSEIKINIYIIYKYIYIHNIYIYII